MTQTLDLPTLLQAAQSWIEEAATHIVAQYRSRRADTKQDGTLVTATDLEIDALIRTRIAAYAPDHAVLSEEGSTHYDPAYRWTWILDPLDGTTNFARGLPICGISLALLDHGMPVLGICAFPLLQETYWGLAGSGAYCNGEALATATQTIPDSRHILVMCTRTPRRYRIDLPLKPRMLGSAAYHLLKVADGAAFGNVESTPMVWDMAAGWLILGEAGGCMVTVDGEPLFPLPPVCTDYANIAHTILAAGNPHLLNALRASISPKVD